MMFWRVFLRLSYSCPEHLKFSLTVSRWTELVKVSRESIDWLDANEHCYDSWIMVAYAASSCALVQVGLCVLATFCPLMFVCFYVSIILGREDVIKKQLHH